MPSSRQHLSLAALLCALALGAGACAAPGTTSASLGDGAASSVAAQPSPAAAPGAETDSDSSAPQALGAPSGAASQATGGSAETQRSTAEASVQEVPEWKQAAPQVIETLNAATDLVVTGSTGTGKRTMQTSARGTTDPAGDFEVTMRQDAGDVELTLLRVKGATYMRGTPAAFVQMTGTGTPESYAQLEGKYVRLGNEVLANLGEDTNVAGLRDELVAMTPAASSELTGTPDTFNDQPTYSFAAKDVIVHVGRAEGHPPVAFVASQGEDVYVLESLDQKVTLQAPPAADVVDAENVIPADS